MANVEDLSRSGVPGPRSLRRLPHRNLLQGFTLVELLVVIAIIGVLVALLLPAVQAAREAARRSQCLNNLKQIGLGFQNYHSAHGHFTPGWTEDNVPTRGDRGPNLGWGFHLLPFVENVPLYEQFDQNQQAASGTPGDGVIENIDLIGTPVENYRCPSANSPETESIAGQGGFYPAIPEYAISNYVGSGSSCEVCNTGHLPDLNNGIEVTAPCFETNQSFPFPISLPRSRHNGVVYRNSDTALKKITDGSSNTFLAGERIFGELPDRATGQVFFTQAYWAGIPGPSSNQLACFAGFLSAYVKFQNQFKTPMVNGHAYGFSSRHPGGVQVVLCDGSARYISEEADNEMIEYMVRIDDAVVVDSI